LSDTLLSTKLYIPRSRGELVPRPRLTERLDAGLKGKLTLVCAPAGYGKTTLVSDWIGRSGIPAAWLSLDASDNDVARFFSYLVAALQAAVQAAVPQSEPLIGATVGSILETDSDPPIERLLTALLNDVAAYEGQIALILDDYHLIHEFQIHQALDFVLDHLPPPSSGGGLHLVIISRANPPMPLGRLRVQGLLTEIRLADLRFTPDEAAAFLNDRMGLGLSGAEIERLEARTEGWVAALHLAALQLAALTTQDRADAGERIATLTGSHRHLIEYLVHEVMARQTEEVRTFLLLTSILERFSASLCDAVRFGQAEPSSIEILEHLERANLFLVPLDDERHWYRYHHLFTDFLRHRLHRLQPTIVSELYIRASQWYEAQGMLDEAIEHALSGGDVTRAARLLDENVKAYILVHAAVSKVLRWADRLPVEERAKFPRLCIYYAWALMFEWQLDAVEPALALAEAWATALQSPQQATSFSVNLIAGHASAIRVYVASRKGEHDRAVDLALAFLQSLPEEEADTDEMRAVRGFVKLGLGQGYYDLGQMEAADQALENALDLCQRADARYAALGCILYLMQAQTVRGALRRAIANGEKGLLWVKEWSGPAGQGGQLARVADQIRRELGRAHYERNNLEQAATNLHQAVETFELAQSLLRVSMYVPLVRLHCALENVDGALRTLQKMVNVSLTVECIKFVPLTVQS
jgi:LuxR family maltose regulon positive regulatory protein